MNWMTATLNRARGREARCRKPDVVFPLPFPVMTEDPFAGLATLRRTGRSHCGAVICDAGGTPSWKPTTLTPLSLKSFQATSNADWGRPMARARHRIHSTCSGLAMKWWRR